MRSHPYFRTTLNLLCIEGAFAVAYDTWLGAGYLGGLAGTMGVSLVFVTILSALPWLGSIGQLLSLSFAGRAGSLKRYSIRLALLARSLWLIPVAMAIFWMMRSLRTSTPFPAHAWFVIVSCTAVASALIGSSSGIGWNSWMRGIIPTGFQARFFGLRQRYIMFTLIIANLVAAAAVGWKVEGIHAGYFALAALAVVCALTSSLLLTFVPDCPPVVQTVIRRANLFTPLRDRSFRTVIVWAGVFNGSIYFCAPYFSYYYTHELAIPMHQLAIWTGLANFGSFVAATFWARRVDAGAASHLSTLRWCGFAAAASPLVYVIPGAATVQLIAPFEFFINGVAWSGILIANSTLLFRACPPGRNVVHFSLYSAFMGLAGVTGVVLGGQTIHWFSGVGGFRALWMVGGLLRIGVLLALLPMVAALLLKQMPRAENKTSPIALPAAPAVAQSPEANLL